MKKRILSVAVIFALVLSVFVMPNIAMAQDYSDYVPEDVTDNLFVNPGNANGIASDNNGSYIKRAFTDGYNAYGFTALKDIDIESAIGAAQRAYYGRLVGAVVKKDGNAFASTQKLKVGSNYVFVLPVKNIGTTDSVTMNIAMSNSANYSSAKYSNEYGADGFTITDKDNYVEFKGTITMPGSTQGAEVSPTVVIGFPDGTPQGAGFAVNLANSGVAKMYFAEEKLYDMSVENIDPESDNVTEAGIAMEFTAAAVNQIGSEMDATFDWYVVNEDRTEVCAEGFTIVPSADTKTAVVTPAKDLTPGNYVVIAEETSGVVDGMKKGVDITVTMPVVRDTEPTGTDPIDDITVELKSGKTTLGIFDKAVFVAAVVNTAGEKGENVQDFKWYAMDEGRVNYVDFINIQVSDDTTEAEISLPTSSAEGTYYIIAESVAAESKGMIQGYEIKIDKTGTVDSMITSVKEGSADDVAENLEVYFEILDITDEHVLAADKADLAALLVGSDAQDVDDSATLAEYIRKLAAVSLLNVNNSALPLTDDDGKLVYADILELSSVDSDGSTIFDLYTSEVSQEGVAKIVADVSGKDFQSYEDFVKAFKESVFLNAIAYPDAMGNGYLADVLTEENLALLSINSGNYFELDDTEYFHKQIAREEYTITKLEKLLKDAEDAPEDDEDEEEESGKVVVRGGGGGGGSISVKKEEPKPEEVTPDITVPDFEDVPKNHWAYTDIHFLRSMGVVDGVDGKNFAPEAMLTREQFLKLIVDSFDIAHRGETREFADVPAGSWFADYVRLGVSAGVTQGISADMFGVGQSITRQDVCVMICRAVGADTTTVDIANLTFSDADTIASYAKESVAFLSSYAVINGFEDGTFKPTDVCTRAQAARIICYALELKEAK